MMSFEDYLRRQHAELFPELLDDELPEAFEAWVSELSVDQWYSFADRAIAEAVETAETPMHIPVPQRPLKMWIN